MENLSVTARGFESEIEQRRGTLDLLKAQ